LVAPRDSENHIHNCSTGGIISITSTEGEDRMTFDTYRGFAERYDSMKYDDPDRRAFFGKIFKKRDMTTLLDCACGTGRDLLMFNSLGLKVTGSDISQAMLDQAERNLTEAAIDIPTELADYRHLPEHFDTEFDAVVCLSNSINEPLEDSETLSALDSMRSVLRMGGLLIFDQGQTDATMQKPPLFTPLVNNSNLSRLLVMEYTGNVQTVHILDFIHSEGKTDFKHSSVQIRIRLQDSWRDLLKMAGFSLVDFFGDWKMSPYNPGSSQRLIVIAQK
jgi:glycine/sarcosine N-methyltransferase